MLKGCKGKWAVVKAVLATWKSKPQSSFGQKVEINYNQP